MTTNRTGSDNRLSNTRHEAFAQAVARGSNQMDAYRLAGYKTRTDQDAKSNASRIAARTEIRRRITELQLNLEDPAIGRQTTRAAARLLDIERKRDILYGIATDERSKPSEVIRAIELDGKYAGDMAPDKSFNVTADVSAGRPGSAARSKEMAAAAQELAARLQAGQDPIQFRALMESTMSAPGSDPAPAGSTLAQNDAITPQDNKALCDREQVKELHAKELRNDG